MPVIQIPTSLRSYTNGQGEIPLHGKTVSEVMTELMFQFPTLRTHVMNTKGELRPHIHLFLGKENIRNLQGLNTPLKEDDRLLLIPSIAGGS